MSDVVLAVSIHDCSGWHTLCRSSVSVLASLAGIYMATNRYKHLNILSVLNKLLSMFSQQNPVVEEAITSSQGNHSPSPAYDIICQPLITSLKMDMSWGALTSPKNTNKITESVLMNRQPGLSHTAPWLPSLPTPGVPAQANSAAPVLKKYNHAPVTKHECVSLRPVNARAWSALMLTSR